MSHVARTQRPQANIVGWAHTPFGKLDAPDVEALMAQVSRAALDHAGVSPEDVDAISVGVYNNGFSNQGFEAALAALSEPALTYVPAVRVENACATGTAAIHSALNAIESGQARIALVIGAEKMTALPTAVVGENLLTGCYRKEEDQVEGGFAGIFARLTEMYFQRYGDKSADLARIAAKNHHNGVSNPWAQMRRDLGFQFCNTISAKNPYVVGPLRRTDCSLVSDGAAALVLADEETAATLQRAIRFRARRQVNDAFPLSRRDPIAFEGARRAWTKAREDAGVTLNDLSLVETHDCFTVAELLEYEAMGLAEPGQGYRVVREGIAEKTGRLPINPSGGLKSKGHPVGATGVSMHVMAAMQLMNEAGEMQIPGASMAGVFNMGGAAVANYVSILERVR